MLIQLTTLQRSGASDPPTRRVEALDPFIVTRIVEERLPGCDGPCCALHLENDVVLHVAGTVHDLVAAINEAQQQE